MAQWYVSSDVMNVLSCSADVLMHDVGLAVRILRCRQSGAGGVRKRDRAGDGVECREVPEGEEDSTRESWIRTYFQSIRNTFWY